QSLRRVTLPRSPRSPDGCLCRPIATDAVQRSRHSARDCNLALIRFDRRGDIGAFEQVGQFVHRTFEVFSLLFGSLGKGFRQGYCTRDTSEVEQIARNSLVFVLTSWNQQQLG